MKGVADRIASGAMYMEYPMAWFSNMPYNGLMQYDIEKNVLRYLGAFPKERSSQYYMHRMAAEYQSQIIFFPDQGSHIHIVDKNTWEIKAVPLKECEKQAFCKITEVFAVKDKFFMLPGNLKNGLLIFHPDERRIESVPVEIENISVLNSYRQPVMFWQACRHGDTIYAPLFDTRYVVELSLKDFRVKIIETDMEHLFGMEIIHNRIWMYPERGNTVISMDMGWKDVKRYTFEKETGPGRVFNHLMAVGDTIVLLPVKGRYLYFIREGEVNQVSCGEFPAEADNEMTEICFWKCAAWRNKLVLFPCQYRQSVVLDMDMQTVEKKMLQLPEKDRKERTKEILKDALNVGVAIGEEEFFTLEDYIEKVTRM